MVEKNLIYVNRGNKMDVSQLSYLKWISSYEGGIEDIDLQHHYFFNLILRLFKQIQIPTADDRYTKELIIELNAYTKFHFTSEENMMMHVDYPKYQEHRAMHLDLLSKLTFH